MAVIPFITRRVYHAVRGRARIEPGTQLYGVNKGGLWFVWAYTSRETAERIDAKVTPGDALDIAGNWRHDTRNLCVSGLAPEKVQL